MQTFPEAPKSYSLIENLRPSASLSGQTSNPDTDLEDRSKVQLRQQITNDLNDIINAAQSANVEDLKLTLKSCIQSLQMLNIPSEQASSEVLLKPFQCEDIVLSRLKQLAMISDIMVERMNEKYVESKGLFEELNKQITTNKKLIDAKVGSELKKMKKAEKRNEGSQQTEKKPSLYIEEKEERVQKTDLKRTRKQMSFKN